MTAPEFDGLVAVVTGGASGIGLAAAQALVARGATVAVLDRAIAGLPEPLRGFVADVSDRASVEQVINAIAAEFGGIDVLVNNAGISAFGTVEENDDAEWARVLDINVVGMARVAASALPWLRRSNAAAVVNLCSIAALNGLPQRALYAASKGAVLALTYAMATDHVREGIRVNCVSPGTVATPFVDRMLAGFADPVAERAALDARQATGRMVEPAEVAAAIVYLASPLSGSTTGTTLEVDGGVTHLRMRPREAGKPHEVSK
ncbi:SDR family oxidoreductase [Plantibacter flavus]|uniref:SDR family NAD(P)-dependent oxidoreductase n=1 Tax=Plantibacter flavus TaxID=150123 RepID=UPI003F13EC2C